MMELLLFGLLGVAIYYAVKAALGGHARDERIREFMEEDERRGGTIFWGEGEGQDWSDPDREPLAQRTKEVE